MGLDRCYFHSTARMFMHFLLVGTNHVFFYNLWPAFSARLGEHQFLCCSMRFSSFNPKPLACILREAR